jgi:VWFA-related protein
MNKQIALVLLFVLIVATPVSVLAQTPSRQQQADEKLLIGTNELVLDAVVRDKKGRPVKDLKASDFQVSEEGTPQDIKSFRLVTGEAVSLDPATKASNGANAKPTHRVMEEFNSGHLGAVALVFDRLSTDSRKRAHDAALSYVGAGLGANDFVGVFGIGLTLSVFQPFTNKDELVKQGIEHAAAANATASSVNSSQTIDLARKDLELRTLLSAAESDAASARDVSGVGGLALDATVNAMTLKVAQGFERLEQTQQGQATTDGLLALISGMGSLPGRKAIIFFSEGVAIPVVMESNFRAVISNANRANVSIYTIDAAGLHAKSSDAEAGKALSTLGQQRAAQAATSRDAAGSMMRDSELNEELIRHNPESGLGTLAAETGGTLVSGTNNPGIRLRQVNEDLHSYYILTYSPKNQNYDGRFRKITVKVNRSGMDVQARKGYYALATTYDSPVMAFEAPALAVLGGKSQPNAFDSRSAAFNFPESARPGLVPVWVEAPLRVINFIGDPEKKTYRTDFSVVVLIKDNSQQVVKKLSSQYLLNGALDQMEAAKHGNLLFYSETELNPGQYTFESVVYDATNGQSSVARGSLLVGDSEQTKLRVSSLIVVGRVEKLQPAELQRPNPFRVGELLLYPNMGEALHKGGGRSLSLFLAVYPAKGSTTQLKLSIEFGQGGKALAALPVQLPAPDQSGRIQYTGTVPLEAFPPGEYELKAVVTDGVAKATRAARFVVAP